MAVRFGDGGLQSYDPSPKAVVSSILRKPIRKKSGGGGGGDSQPMSLRLTPEEIKARTDAKARAELEKRIEAERVANAKRIAEQKNRELLLAKTEAERRKIKLEKLKALEELKLRRAEQLSRINPNIQVKGSMQKRYEQSYKQTNRRIFDEIRYSLPKGEEIIYDPKTYEIKGIQSSLLEKTIPFTSQAIREYNLSLKRLPRSQTIKQQLEEKVKEKLKTGVSYKLGSLEQLRQTYVKIKANADMNFFKYKRERDRLLKQGKKLNSKELRDATAGLSYYRKRRLESTSALRLIETFQGIKLLPGVLKTIGKELYQTKGLSLIPIEPTGRDRLDLSKISQRQGKAQFRFKQNAINSLSVSLAKGIWDDWNDTWQLLKVSPDKAIVKVGTDYLLLSAVSKGLKITGKVSGKIARRISPKWKSFSKNIIQLQVPKEVFERRGKQIFLKKRVGKFRTPIDIIKGRKTGQFKKFQKTSGITLKKGLLTDSATSLREQIKLGGTRGTITTAQADRLVNFLRRSKIIRKPIPGEANFTKLTKALLKKFDEGRINKAEFTKLNLRVIKESGGKTLLERSLYATPDGVVRFTRLGSDVTEANWRDILRGNFSLKKQRPQVIVFPEGKIAKLPKSLKDIVKKLNQGKKLTELERTRLVKWQTKRGSGKWKPIGDTEYRGGIELEVTLAPGETIRRVKRLAITEINGVGVDIVEAKIIKLSKESTRLLNKAKLGKILKNEIDKLRKLLKKETNLPVSSKDIRGIGRSIRRRTYSRPRLPLNRIIIERGVIQAKRLLRRKKTIRKPIRRKTISRKKITRRVQRKPTRRREPIKRTPRKRRTPRRAVRRKPTPRKPTPRKPRPRTPKSNKRTRGRTTRGRTSTSGITKKKTLVKPRSRFQQKTLRKAVPTYYVVEKRRGKFKKLYAKPLTLKDARDYAVYSIDNKLSRTAFFVPLRKSKKVVSPPSKIKGYYTRNSRKVRPYRIRFGKKRMLVNGYIEKRKYISDTPGEKRGLKTLKRRSKKKTSTKKRRK